MSQIWQLYISFISKVLLPFESEPIIRLKSAVNACCWQSLTLAVYDVAKQICVKSGAIWWRCRSCWYQHQFKGCHEMEWNATESYIWCSPWQETQDSWHFTFCWWIVPHQLCTRQKLCFEIFQNQSVHTEASFSGQINFHLLPHISFPFFFKWYCIVYVYPVCFFFKRFRLSFPSWCMMYWSKETFMLVAQAIRSGKGVKKENGTNIIWLSSDQPDACVAKTGRQSHLWAIHHLNRFPGSPPSSCKIL